MLCADLGDVRLGTASSLLHLPDIFISSTHAMDVDASATY